MQTTMKSHVNYSRLRTIEDVRKERQRINMELRYTTRRIEDNWDQISDYFTVDYWLDYVLRVTGNVGSSVRTVISGFSTILSLFKGRQGRYEEQ